MAEDADSRATPDATGADLDRTLAAAAIALGLRPRADIDEPGWRFWELRTLNRHRVVALDRRATAATPADLAAEVRSAIGRHFRRAWWRGLAFGAVVEVGEVPWAVADLVPLVDAYESHHGVLQWLVVVEPSARRALGVHTWEAVFLSPVYRAALGALAAEGFDLARAVKSKDGVWRFLTGVSAAEGVNFPEYQDE